VNISRKAIRKARAAIYTKGRVGKMFLRSCLKNILVKTNKPFYEAEKKCFGNMLCFSSQFSERPPICKKWIFNQLPQCGLNLHGMLFCRKKPLTTFHYALKEKGFLLLGKSETIGGLLPICFFHIL